jgi:uncharacterized protein YbbK (DUF523 family)
MDLADDNNSLLKRTKMYKKTNIKKIETNRDFIFVCTLPWVNKKLVAKQDDSVQEDKEKNGSAVFSRYNFCSGILSFSTSIAMAVVLLTNKLPSCYMEYIKTLHLPFYPMHSLP